MIETFDKIISMEQLRIIVVGAISSLLAIITPHKNEFVNIVDFKIINFISRTY